MNFVKIGATTVKVGANAVARLFLSCVSAERTDEIAALVLSENCARF